MNTNGWAETTIGELVNIQRGLTWQSEQEVAEPIEGSVPVLRIPNVQETLTTSDLRYLVGVTDDQKAKHAAAKNWILMVGSNGNPKRVGNCVLIEDESDFLFASFLLGINGRNPEKMDPKYLFQLLRSAPIQDAISESVQGSTGLRNISVKMLRGLTVAVPPLPEQQKIVAILGSVDDAIQATQAVIDQTRKVKAGLLQQFLMRGIGHTRFKQTEIGEVPASWTVTTIGTLCAAKGGKRLPKGSSYASSPTEYPYIRVSDFADGTVSIKDIKYVEREIFEQIKRYTIDSDDVYISIAGSLGIVGLVPPQLSGSLLTENAAKLVIRDKGLLCKEFLLYYLQSPTFQAIVEREKGVQGVPKLALFRIEASEICLPPLSEQYQIASTLGGFDDALRNYQSHLAQLLRLKSGLMDDLLSGRTRVEVPA